MVPRTQVDLKERFGKMKVGSDMKRLQSSGNHQSCPKAENYADFAVSSVNGTGLVSLLKGKHHLHRGKGDFCVAEKSKWLALKIESHENSTTPCCFSSLMDMFMVVTLISCNLTLTYPI
jgi:hypothetical protein